LVIVDKIFEYKVKDFLSHKKDDDIIYVTDFIKCPMKEYYEKVYKELAIEDQKAATVIMGDFVHVGVQEFIKNNFPNAQIEVEVGKDIEVNGKKVKIRGRLDALIEVNGEKIIVEIKSRKSGESIPKDYHILQLQLYLWITGIKKGLLVYITHGKIAEFEVNNTLSDKEVIEMAKEVLEFKKVPKFEWECRYCVFNSVCKYALNSIRK